MQHDKAQTAPADTITDTPTGNAGTGTAWQQTCSDMLRTTADMIDLQHNLLVRIAGELTVHSGSVSIETAGLLSAYLDDLDAEVN